MVLQCQFVPKFGLESVYPKKKHHHIIHSEEFSQITNIQSCLQFIRFCHLPSRCLNLTCIAESGTQLRPRKASANSLTDNGIVADQNWGYNKRSRADWVDYAPNSKMKFQWFQLFDPNKKKQFKKKTTKLTISFHIKHLWDPLFAMSLVFFGVRKSPQLQNLSHFDGLSLWSLRLQRSFACHHLCSASSHTFTTGQTSPLGVGIVYMAIKWDLKTR